MTTGPFANFISGGDTHWTPSTTFTADGDILAATQYEYAIDNPHPGVTQGYSIHLFSSEGDEFTYGEDGPPTGGTIDHVEVRDAGPEGGHTYFDIYGTFADPSLTTFLDELQNFGAKAALDHLVGDGLTLCGSEDGDYAETYGQFGQYFLNEGNDFLDISYSNTTAYGGTGDDTFTVSKGGLLGLSLHGGSPTPALTTESDNNTIAFSAPGTLSFVQIDDFTNFKFTGTGGAQFIYLMTDQLPGGSVSNFHVFGSATGQTNEVVIERASPAAVHLNLSNVIATNFARLDQAFIFDFTDDAAAPRNDFVRGVVNARNVFEFDAGNDRAIGGNRADIFSGGQGNDTFNGGLGNDVAEFDGRRSQFTITKLAAHTYSVHDHRLHSPDGTDILYNVEYLAFDNGYVFIGGSTSSTAASVASTAHLADLHA